MKSNRIMNISFKDNDIWRPVKGYEDLYEISITGKVKSRIVRRTHKDPTGVLSQHNMKGCWSVRLSRKGKGKVYAVSHLVVQAFSGLPITADDISRVKHIDGDISNNFLNNIKVYLNEGVSLI